MRKKVHWYVFLAMGMLFFWLTGCVQQSKAEGQREESPSTKVMEQSAGEEDQVEEIKKTGSMQLSYANQFQIDYYEDGYRYIRVEDGNEYVLIPEGKKSTNLGYLNATLISIPCDSVYLAASSATDLFICLQSLERVKACSTTEQDYAMEEMKSKIRNQEIVYVGKYSAPDYEMLLGLNTDVAIESTMIYHTPKVKEQLEALHIPVFVERSSYEEEPLGRLEWVRLYGVLTGKEEEADRFFEEEKKKVESLIDGLSENVKKVEDAERKSVAFFYISSNGYVNVRKPGDYICRMIEIAGGTYRLNNLLSDEDNALSTMNINWEDFYREAKDADILIYNGTIDKGVDSLEDLMEKNELFRDFKALQTGEVYSTSLNMYQETGKVSDVIVDFYHVIQGGEESTTYLKRLE